MVDRDRALTDRARRLMQLAYDRFRARATWPDLETLQRELDRTDEDFDVEAAAKEIPRRFAYGRLEPGGAIRLNLRGVLDCAGSGDDASNFLRALHLAVEKRRGPEEKPAITSEDFVELGLDETAHRRLLALIDSEGYIVAGGHSNDRGWSRYVSSRMRRFRHVETVADYFEVRDALDAELAREAADYSMPLPGSPLAHLRDIFQPASITEPSRDAVPQDPVAITGRAMATRYAELEQRAGVLLQRLENGAPLTPVLPGAYSVFSEAGDDENAYRVVLETQGFYYLKDRRQTSESEVRGVASYLRSRSIEMTKSDATQAGFAIHPMVELERILDVAETQPSPGLFAVTRDIRVVVERVRMDLVVGLTELRQRMRQDFQAIDIFGPEALSVLDAGGATLAPLRRAAAIIRTGSAPGAALEARSALIAIGERLMSKGPRRRKSPIDGRSYSVDGEKNRVHAVLDELWHLTQDEARRALLNDAHAAVDRAYEIGSKAKHPGAVTSDECAMCLRLTFQVARAVALCAGFPIAPATNPERANSLSLG